MTAPDSPLKLGPLVILRQTRADALRLVLAALDGSGGRQAIGFCNAHTAEVALRNPAYARALGGMTLFNDGVGVEIAARVLEGRGFPANLNGTDFLPVVFGRLERPTRVYLLGATEGVAAEAGAKFAAVFPNVDIVGARDGYFPAGEEAGIVAEVAAARPDMLLVALGNPRQEMFINRNFDAFGVRVAFGVGALFDFTAGRARRAPEWARAARVEWLYRLAQEPARLLRRYTVETGRFLLAVLKLRLSGAGRHSP